MKTKLKEKKRKKILISSLGAENVCLIIVGFNDTFKNSILYRGGLAKPSTFCIN
jgi:hypothetical protein